MYLIQYAQQVSQLFLVCMLQDRQAKRQAMSTVGCPPIIAHEVMIISPSRGVSLPQCMKTEHRTFLYRCTCA